MKIAEYQKIKDVVERRKEQRDKAIGAHEAAMERLKLLWGCATIKQAHEKLAQLEKEEAELTKKISAALDDFQQKWSHLIQED